MTTIDMLKNAHGVLVAAVPKKRREAHKSEGQLAATFRQAMIFWDAAKAQGVSLDERVDGLTKTLRQCWPFTREWKYLCAACDDYGLVMRSCPGDVIICGRSRPHLPHEFGTPCECPKGAAFRVQPRPDRGDFRAAGKSQPSRVGR